MNKWLVTLSISAFLAISGNVLAAGDPAAGKIKSVTCIGCHGADGNSANPAWPKLAGQHASYLKKQMLDFKTGKSRNSAMMAPMVAGLDDQAMDDLAAYFSAQTQTTGKAEADKVELGEQIFRGGIPDKEVAACMACHGPAGMGNPPAKFPRLSGQHAMYTSQTLKDFRSGKRSNDSGKMMRDVVERMTDTEIDAVASYLQGLQ